MSNLTDLLPAGAGGKQVDFVASGTIGNGVTVALKADGTVEAVDLSAEELGSEYVFENATSYDIRTSPIGSSKFVIAYRDAGNSNYGTAIVATISGTSISYGTPVVFNSVLTSQTTIAYDASNDKVLICYRGTSSYGYGIVGTVSGTSISFGSQSGFGTNRRATALASVYDPNNQKILITYIDQGNGDYGTVQAATISGTSVSFGSANSFNNGSTGSTDIAYNVDDSNFIVGYKDTAAGGYAYARVGTFNGTSFSFGSETVVSYDTAEKIKISYTTDSKVVLVYQNGSNSNNATAAVGTVSGTSISFGTTLTVSTTTNAFDLDVTYDTTNAKVVFVYANATTSGLVRPATVSGTSLTLETATTFNTGAVNSSLCINYGADTGSCLIAYTDGGNSSYGTAAVFKNVSSNNTDFIGISDAAISDTASGSVTIKGGISTNVTGLTPNQNYYVQSDGSLSTTASDVLAGKALSSTSINLDYTT